MMLCGIKANEDAHSASNNNSHGWNKNTNRPNKRIGRLCASDRERKWKAKRERAAAHGLYFIHIKCNIIIIVVVVVDVVCTHGAHTHCTNGWQNVGSRGIDESGEAEAERGTYRMEHKQRIIIERLRINEITHDSLSIYRIARSLRTNRIGLRAPTHACDAREPFSRTLYPLHGLSLTRDAVRGYACVSVRALCVLF